MSEIIRVEFDAKFGDVGKVKEPQWGEHEEDTLLFLDFEKSWNELWILRLEGHNGSHTVNLKAIKFCNSKGGVVYILRVLFENLFEEEKTQKKRPSSEKIEGFGIQ